MLKIGLEKRKAKRYRVEDGAYVAVLADNKKIGTILDISPLGLAFRYMADTAGCEPMNGRIKLRIFHAGDHFHIYDVSLQTAADIELAETGFFGSPPTRRLSGRFVNVTPKHRKQLALFIRNYSV